MSTMRDAANQLAKHRRLAQSLLELIEAADSAASLEGAVSERTAALEGLKREVEAAEQQLVGKRDELEKLRLDAEQLIQSARRDAADIIAQAKEKARDLFAATEAEANAAAALRKQRMADISGLDAQIADASKHLLELQSQTTRAQRIADVLNAA